MESKLHLNVYKNYPKLNTDIDLKDGVVKLNANFFNQKLSNGI